MKNVYNFLSGKCNAEYVADITEVALSNGCLPALDSNSGYLLINNLLVPQSFVAQVDAELADTPIEYGFVLSEAYLFKPEFLESLDELEREILMPVVLHLIELGSFGFQFFGADLEAA
jgi:hypothetical protein